jgi:cytochrome P450
MQTAQWLLAPVQFMEGCRRRHGETFSVRFVGFEQPMVLISDPSAIRALYSQREQLLPPGRFAQLAPMVGPDSLLLVQGAGHLERRRMMLPPFHGEQMRTFEATMREIAEAQIAVWPQGEVAIQPLTRALTLEVILRLVAGVTDGARLAHMRALIPDLLDGGASVSTSVRVLIARRFGRSDPLEALSAQIRELDGDLLDEITERRERGDDGAGDVLSMLMAARFEDGRGMSDWELRDQLVTLLVAGHETTATALAWAFELLTHNPPALERLVEEVRDGSGDQWLRAVIAETLRLRPVVPLAGRRLAADLECDGYTLPTGSDVSPAIWLTHTRADLYEDPYAFRPERFLDKAPGTYAWIPFGGGVRRCLGAAFAELELRVVLRAVLERFDVSSRRGAEKVMRRGPTFAPRHGTRVRLRPRYTSSESRSPRSASDSSTAGSAAAVRRHEPSAL